MIEPRMAEFIQANAGKKLSILFVLFATSAPIDVAEIAAITDYSRKTVGDALHALEKTGYVAQMAPIGNRWGRWTLTDKARQMSLPGLFNQLDRADPATATGAGEASAPATAIGSHTGDAPSQASSAPPDLTDPATAIGVGVESDGRKIYASPGSVVVDQQIRSDLLDQQQQQQQQQGAVMGKNYASNPGALQACVEAGITGQKRGELLGDLWTTGDRIRRAVRQARLEGQWDRPVGMAITRLLSHVEPLSASELDEWEAEQETDASPQVVESVQPDESVTRECRRQWQAALSELQLQVTKPTFETWVKPTRLVHVEENGQATRFVIGAPSAFGRDWLESKLISSIQRALSGIIGRTVEVEFVVSEE